jgi:hypothetical protein
LSWINKIFGTKKNTEVVENIPTRKIDYIQITTEWNADPVSPEIELNVDGTDLIMDIFLNHYVFDNFKKGDKAKIRFKNCAKYSLNTCNDEGYYYGQYRTNPNELPWGEFYEIKSGLDRNMPNPIVHITKDSSGKKHFIFFFKDETFECLALEYELKFYNENEQSTERKKTELILTKGEQPVPTILDEELNFLIGREFPNDKETVKTKLNNINSDSQKGKNRISASVLKLADMEIDKIDLLVKRANEDLRDIISEAEYPKASSFGFGERNEKENKSDYLEDWEEYSTWKERK